jgi:hypothetical protein
MKKGHTKCSIECDNFSRTHVYLMTAVYSRNISYMKQKKNIAFKTVIHTVAHRLVARQRPQKKQRDNRRCKAEARASMDWQESCVFWAVRADGCSCNGIDNSRGTVFSVLSVPIS